MADNTTLNAGSGGDTYASDDIGGVKFQRVKLVEGADGSNDGDISAANPLPVTVQSETVAVSNAGLTELAGAISGGELAVTIASSSTTLNVSETGSALTALQLIDDVIYVDDADWTDNTSKHALVGGVYQSSPK